VRGVIRLERLCGEDFEHVQCRGTQPGDAIQATPMGWAAITLWETCRMICRYKGALA
jgi:hypothetical protein